MKLVALREGGVNKMRYITLFLAIIVSLFLIAPSVGYAQCPICCPCGKTCSGPTSNCSSGCVCQSNAETEHDIPFITEEFLKHREWIIKHLWEAHTLPAMMLMTESLSTAIMHQAKIIGGFFDAKQQMETQRLLQSRQASHHKDYHPSIGMCRFGTTTKSLAASDRNAEVANIVLSRRNIQRQLLSADTIAARGSISDRRSRWVQYKEKYCNPKDNANQLDAICQASDPERFRKDIDFTQTIERPQTLEADFTNGSPTNDEEDILALGANLYGSTLFNRIPEQKLAKKDGTPLYGAELYLQMRALAAKRNVAYSAFAAQAAMKTQGEDASQPYMLAIMKKMGIEEDDVKETIGDKPSYYAQMEMLTKTLYQTPDFYTELYDKPVNIDRKIASMQAINSMQRRDMYHSQRRSEAISSILLESFIKPIEDEAVNELNDATLDDPIVNEGVRKALGL